MPTKKPASATPIYQLKLVLEQVTPPVWRRMLIPADTTLPDLHAIIQIAMGWEDDHLHEFIVAHKRYSDPSAGGIDDLFDDDEVASESKVRLRAIAPAVRNSFRYHYDFGDSWMHKLTVEKQLATESGQTYPVCIGGARACPPEDCGGVWGYEELVEVLKNPKHPEHEEKLEWVGDDFDPERFDLAEVNRDLQQYCARTPSSRRQPGKVLEAKHDTAR